MDKFFEHWINNIRNWRIKTCCCLAPLRIGLLIIGYCNVFIAVTLIVGTASDSFAPTIKHVQELVLEDDASPSVCILAPTAELAFTVLLLCGVHRNDVILLRSYVYYGIAEIVLSILVYSIVIAKISVLYLILIAFNCCYEAYIIFLARSLIIEIRRVSATNGTLTEEKVITIEDPKAATTKYDKLAKNTEENVKVEFVNENETLQNGNDRNIQDTNDNDTQIEETHNTNSVKSIKKEKDSKTLPTIEKNKINNIESKTIATNKAITEEKKRIEPKSDLITRKISDPTITKRTISSNKNRDLKQSKLDSFTTEDVNKSNDVSEEMDTSNLKEKLSKLNSKTMGKGVKSIDSPKAEQSKNSKAVKDERLNAISELKNEDANSLDKNKIIPEDAKDEEINNKADDKNETAPTKKNRGFWRK